MSGIKIDPYLPFLFKIVSLVFYLSSVFPSVQKRSFNLINEQI